MDLFDLQINNENYAPLSERMRPENFEKFVGQSHIKTTRYRTQKL